MQLYICVDIMFKQSVVLECPWIEWCGHSAGHFPGSGILMLNVLLSGYSTFRATAFRYMSFLSTSKGLSGVITVNS